MNYKVTKLFTMITLLFCIVFPNTTFGQYTVGDTVANFTLYDVDTNQVSLYDFYGDLVLLNFYTTW